MKFGCLILAAGQGERFGTEKQFHSWNGRFMWQHAYELAHQLTDEVVIVGMDIDGGRTRQESVKNGLRLISSPRVVILEVVQPLIQKKHIMNLIKRTHSSVTYGMRLDEAVFASDDKYYRDFDLISNPQAFDTALLKEAHDKTKLKNTPEDTMIMKDVHNISPLIIEGDPRLHKIVTRGDLDIINAIARR
jgi:2-C-methyl-D-erythritol 4-phosphate cytidylyltransferase